MDLLNLPSTSTSRNINPVDGISIPPVVEDDIFLDVNPQQQLPEQENIEDNTERPGIQTNLNQNELIQNQASNERTSSEIEAPNLERASNQVETPILDKGRPKRDRRKPNWFGF